MAEIRVLLIEDDPSYARLIEQTLALSSIGFNVTVAVTLREALTTLSERRFNLILTVLDLPDEKGLNTLDAIRSAESTIPLVVLTSRIDPNLETQAISHGAQFCLRKSEIDTQSLLNAMPRAVQISRLRSPAMSDKHADRLITELEENIVAIGSALTILDIERHDSPQRDAVHAIRSHIGAMQEKIGKYRSAAPTMETPT